MKIDKHLVNFLRTLAFYIAKTKKYPEEFKKQIVELYENGKSVINLAREYGLVEQTIYKWIHRYETVAKDKSGKDVSQADINVMKKRIAELGNH